MPEKLAPSTPDDRTQPVDAGAAPNGGNSTGASVGHRHAGEERAVADDPTDAGAPPNWLVDAVVQAGGMTAPTSPEDIELAGVDAGSAPQ
ncbi:MAG: hypothetical protein L0H41_12420 [Microlunatus sp.]|nr:hypothetical protein [Microlunatus sp.]